MFNSRQEPFSHAFKIFNVYESEIVLTLNTVILAENQHVFPTIIFGL